MKNLVSLRKQFGLSQQQFANDIGLARNTICQYESGRRAPDVSTLMTIANYFNVSVDYLLGRTTTELISEISGSEETKDRFKQAQAMYYLNEKLGAHLKNISEVSGLIVFEEIGTVCAGFDGAIDEIPTGRKIEIPASMISCGKKEDYFVLRVKGNSMYPRLLDGDTILCKRCESVDSGSFAVVLYDGDEATIKKVNYVNGENWLELIPINPEYPTKRIEGADLEQCRVLGLVVKLIRDL